MYSKRLIIILLVVGLLTTGCGFSGGLDDSFNFENKNDSKTQVITFGRLPSETVISLLEDHEPFIEYLQKELSQDDLKADIQFRFRSDYEQIINGMTNHEYNFVFLGPYSYLLARKELSDEEFNYEAVVRPERYGNEWYEGIIFTHKDHDADTIADLEGKSIAFVEEESTSGYLFPKSTLIDAGVSHNLENYFQSISFLGRHDRVVRAVYRKEYVAGATYKDARTSAGLDLSTEEANKILPIFATTKKIPTSPIAVSEKFKKKNPKLTNRIVELLTKLHTTVQGNRVLDRVGIDRYIKSEPGDYDQVREVMKTLKK